VDFDADELMQHVVDAGMKYFVITAKHHDGFALFPSDAYPYDIRLTAYQKDPMKALREAARKRGVKFGFYYSHAFDWEHPDAPGNDWDYDNPGGDKLLGGANWWEGERKDFLSHAEKYVTEKSIPQIQELIRNYDPDILWFDTPAKLPLYLNVRILEAIRKEDVQNKIVVNGRLVRFGGENMGDYRNTGDRAAYFYPTKGLWESIPTTNESYGYSAVDTVRKSVSHFVRLLASATSKGGNILMNVGPMGNGKWDEKDVTIFNGVGKWLQVNGESIYGAVKTDLPIQPWGVMTQKGDTLYAHVYEWPSDGKLIIGGLRSKIEKVWILPQSQSQCSIRHLNVDDCELLLPKEVPDSINTVVALLVKKHIQSNQTRLLDSESNNILYAFDAELLGKDFGYGDGKPNRNYVKGWHNNNQSLKWEFRLNHSSVFDVYLDYNTEQKHDSGIVVVEIGGKAYEVNYKGFVEKDGINSIKIGTILMERGSHSCSLRGRAFVGSQFMRPVAVRMVKK
jgi:hypothetical protein